MFCWNHHVPPGPPVELPVEVSPASFVLPAGVLEKSVFQLLANDCVVLVAYVAVPEILIAHVPLFVTA